MIVAMAYPAATAAARGAGHAGATKASGGTSGSSATNTFSPASYVDYHELGGEPTTVVDHYPFVPGPYSFGASSPQYRDVVYVSNPLGLGLPGYSEFYKSSDGGTSFRVPPHMPQGTNEPFGTEASGGGDSHQAVGDVTHSVFFVDLSGGCVTMNVSRDLGETFSSNKLGCEANPGAIDDRQWVATDETAPDGQDVYLNFNNDTGCFALTEPGCSIVLVKSTDDGGSNTPGDWSASGCNAFTMTTDKGAPDNQPTVCPDPSDDQLWISGPVTPDKSTTSPYRHRVYIPFERYNGSTYQIYVAISNDEGNTWTRRLVADVGNHDPANIFPQLTTDTAGNIYYTWAQTTGDPGAPNGGGETDVYYSHSTDGGTSWSAPTDLTPQRNDSAVFPWLAAGDPGHVDLVYYASNTGLNPNVGGTTSSGAGCDPTSDTGCTPNTSQWKTYFAQSQNALNPGANFKAVQVSEHPIHIGGVCTGGISCNGTQYANRDLLDFFTVDIDHLGAAYITWADDNNSRHDTHQFFARQLSGSSVFANQNISQQNSWPITSHSAVDPAGDTTDATGTPTPCPAMDVLGDSLDRSGDTVTATLTLGVPPTAAAAAACGGSGSSGGLWGLEFWAAANPTGDIAEYKNDNFYVAYRDNPLDGSPRVEGGAMNGLSPSFTHTEPEAYEGGTLGGTCFSSPAPTPCTLTMTTTLSALGVKSGSVLSSVTGWALYVAGSSTDVPATRVPLENTDQADAAAPYDVNGTATTG